MSLSAACRWHLTLPSDCAQEYFSNLFNSFTNLVKSAGAGPDRPFFSCNDCTHASTFSANVHGAHRVQALCITRVRTHLRSHANNQRRKQERYSEALTRRGRAGAKVFELLERKCQVTSSMCSGTVQELT